MSVIKPTKPMPATGEPVATDLPDPSRPVRPSAPGATIEVRHVDAATGVIVSVTGVIGRNDAAVLSRQLHTTLDAAPAVVVVNLSQVLCVAMACRNVLATVRDRARSDGIALHVVDPGDCLAGDQLIAEQAWRAATSSPSDRQ